MKKVIFCLVFFISVVELLGADIVYNVKYTDNLVFFGTRYPVIDLSVYNNDKESVKRDIKCSVKSDKGELVYQLTQQVSILSGDSTNVSFKFYSSQPGFYRILLEDGNELIKEFNLCYDPEKISADYPNMRDVDSYWKWVKKRSLYKSPDYKVVKIKSKKKVIRDAYSVSMKFSNGEILQGNMFIPKDNKSPLMVRARLLYGSTVNLENEMENTSNCIDFVLPVNTVEIKDSLFYTGIILKYIASIDFLTSRKESADKNIFVVGEGFTGGLSLIAAAVDARIKGVAVYNPFIDETNLKTSSNIILGRIVPLIKSPVLFGMGLQDSIASPRRLFDIYNTMRTVKEYYIFPFSASEEHGNWNALKDNFLLKYY